MNIRPYFPNLEAEISKSGVKKKDIAKILTIHPRTLSLKMTGKTEFLLSEALYIHSLFPSVPVEELFEHRKEMR